VTPSIIFSSSCITISLRCSASFIGWRLQSGLLWSVPSSSSRVCTMVPCRRTFSSGRRRGSSLTAFRLVFIADRRPCLTSASDPFRLPLLVYDTAYQSTSLVCLRRVSYGRSSSATFSVFYFLLNTWLHVQCPRSDHVIWVTLTVLVTYFLTYLLYWRNGTLDSYELFKTT